MNPFSCSTRKSASSSQLSRYWITTWCGTYCQKGCLVCLLPCVALIAIVLLNFRSSKQPNLLWLAMEEMYRTTLGMDRLSEHVCVSRIRRRVNSNTRFVKIAWKAESEFWKRNIKPLCVPDHSVRRAPGQYIRAGGPFYCAKLRRRHRPTGRTVFEGLHNQNNISHSPCRQTP